MKILMINDVANDGIEKNAALGEMLQVFANEKYDVSVVNVDTSLSEDVVKKTAKLMGTTDVVVFENSDQMSKTLIERILSLTDAKNLRAENDALQESNDTLTRDNASLQEHNDTLTRDNASLQSYNDELQRSNFALQADNDSLQRNYNTLQENNVVLRHDSREDSLTRVLNRRGFDEDSKRFIENHPSFILISIDINDFKLFNDLYGHHIGDQLLIELADEFRALIPKGDIVARSGGDEFQLLIARPDSKWMQHASDFFNAVHAFEFEDKHYTYMLSAGFASFPEQTHDFGTLVRMADSALYHAKMLAKEKFWKYEPEMDHDVRYSLGFNARNLAETAPGAMLIYRADDTREILFSNPLCAELFGYSSQVEFTEQVKSFRSLVHPDDQKKVDEDLETQLKGSESQGKEYVTYRVVCKDGTVKNVFSTRRLVSNAHFGNIFYSFLFDYTIVDGELKKTGV